ncbi:MAG: DUF1570 domain-containing protein [Verrucomicrobiae bacterium]|nr:DUF1570 domain-containing protein [Verrucomicrobiae bacterium]MDW8343756.1 DUF1570 domain-containing protein [Verrucomicrobiae bacterium]
MRRITVAAVFLNALGLAAAWLSLPYSRPSSQPAHITSDYPPLPHQNIICPPYRIYSDDSPETIAHLARVLRAIQTEFLAVFGANSPPSEPAPQVDVYWFANQHDFQVYVSRIAPHLCHSAGFFWHDRNRLVLLNQQGTERYRQFLGLHSLPAAHPDNCAHATGFAASWQHAVTSAAREANDRLIRHEAAHQLFQQYGWLSPTGAEPTWLTEGLAQFCEPTPIGSWHPTLAARLRHFRDTGLLIPLPEFLECRDPTGFFNRDLLHTEIAYAQSWALVWWLMQPPHRESFLRFLKSGGLFEPQYEQHQPTTTGMLQMLAAALHLTDSALLSAWHDWLNQL